MLRSRPETFESSAMSDRAPVTALELIEAQVKLEDAEREALAAWDKRIAAKNALTDADAAYEFARGLSADARLELHTLKKRVFEEAPSE